MFTRKKALVASLILLIFLYVGTLGSLTRYAAYPKWYRPAQTVNFKSSDLSLPPCSSYQKTTYVFCDDPKVNLGLDFQEVSFEEEVNHKTIGFAGWYIPVTAPAKPKALIILVHGAGADRRAMLKHAPYLHKAGYALLVMDTHNHGLAFNDGRGISFGLKESLSIGLVPHWMEKTGIKLPIIGFGTSQGAFSVLYTASLGLPLHAIIAENPYFSVKRVLTEVPLLTVIPSFFKTQSITLLSFWLGGDLFELDGDLFLKKIQQPVLFIHGENDDFVPHIHSQDMIAKISSKQKELWLVPYGYHEKLWNLNPSEYEKRVLEFLDKCL